ncbi:ATP-binding cassette domain-containing protein [Robertmurraya korlensis]|uniref:phosphonate ABC transporter ATP-binding protein n=1 Tax=Robertmurraya korlensis TaxID=519977 RepID=UPI00203F495C|nr:ATP-binding cassette domain-containing protein [Robertmurraya korlensis]
METSQNIIELKDVSVSFDGKIALSSLSLLIKKGERIALIGPSGAGKSTLLNVLSLSNVSGTGTIRIDGQPPSFYRNRKVRAKKIGVIRQQFDLVNALPVVHNVLAGKLADWSLFKSLLSLVIPQEKEIAEYALSRVGLVHKISEQTGSLSGGEQQRVALARLLVQQPEVILADEPVASLDPARAEDVLDILTKLVQEEKQTLITSLHSVDYAKKYFTRVIGLREGGMIFDLPVDQLTDRHLKDLYKLRETRE